MFGTLALCTTAAASALKFHENRNLYTLPIMMDYEKAWYYAGKYFLDVWTLYTTVWFMYFFELVPFVPSKVILIVWKILVYLNWLVQPSITVTIGYLWHYYRKTDLLNQENIWTAFLAVHLFSAVANLALS